MSKPYGIDASDFVDASKALERHGFERQAGITVAYAIKRSANAVRRNVRGELKRHRKSGRLSRAVIVKSRGTGLDIVTKVKSAGPIAHLVSGGVAPHDIDAEPGGVMVIRGPGAGFRPTIGYATAVRHPGFQGDPYFARGVRKAAPEINAILQKSADTMARELAFRMERGKRG